MENEMTLEQLQKIKITPARLVFLRTLKEGPKTWKDLKDAYYGPERGKSKSHTSFQNQIIKLKARGIIKHEDGHYELTPMAQQWLSIIDDSQMEAAKSLAQQQYKVTDEKGDA